MTPKVREVVFGAGIIICLIEKLISASAQVSALYPELHAFLDAAFWSAIAVGIIWTIGESILRHLRIGRELRIHWPLGGENVEFKSTVRGSVRPVGRQVQVFVWAGDQMWHPQSMPDIRGESWEIVCQFGDDPSPIPAPRHYRLAAISTYPRIARPIRRLPFFAAHSQKVWVIRKI